jgi:hypothetical protein
MSFEAFFATNFLGFKHPRIMIPLAPDCRIAKLKSINIVIIAIIQKDHQLIYIYLPLFKEGFASFSSKKNHRQIVLKNSQCAQGPGSALRFKFFWNQVVWRMDEATNPW